jgi:hypothetical protein
MNEQHTAAPVVSHDAAPRPVAARKPFERPTVAHLGDMTAFTLIGSGGGPIG